jgi:hypothetical protein
MEARTKNQPVPTRVESDRDSLMNQFFPGIHPSLRDGLMRGLLEVYREQGRGVSLRTFIEQGNQKL